MSEEAVAVEMTPFAHTKENHIGHICAEAEWQPLLTHLRGVARRAALFASEFDSHQWGFLAGLWHDVGKYRPEFQAYLRASADARKSHLPGPSHGPEHAGAGAALAHSIDPERGLALAFVIAGHHAGLSNFITSESHLPTPLTERLVRNFQLLSELLPRVPQAIKIRSMPDFPSWVIATSNASQHRRAHGMEAHKRTCEFWTRFLFSALVDADRLDTERFDKPDRARLRRTQYASIPELCSRLDRAIDSKVAALSAEDAATPVNRARAGILQDCREKADCAPGLFSLTVPTGGGKTLSAMSFALRHAKHHGMRRIIVVIPFTSVIEQNAEAYRASLRRDETDLGEDVLVHHSSLDPERERQVRGPEITSRHELSTENWDAPVIVTTTVQFFETLFTGKASRARKLHNVARSVIILDEVQTLPPEFLSPIIDGLRELAANYGCSIVLSTATPPALAKRLSWPDGLEGVEEILTDGEPARLAVELRRVDYTWPDPDPKAPPKEWPDLATEIAALDQALIVVHRRTDARLLAQLLAVIRAESEVVHLSALMCPAHRKEVIARVRERLKQKFPCLLVSTQLIEAGVDLDFPVVYRALGGLDSIVQAAGRCNREGKLPTKGRVIIFKSSSNPPPGTPSKALIETTKLLRKYGPYGLDPNSPEICLEYFRNLYFAGTTDGKQIQTSRQQFNFGTVGRDFRLIEDGFTETVVVPWGEGPRRLDDLRRNGPSRDRFRALQPFTVSVYRNAFNGLLKNGAVEEIQWLSESLGIYELTAPYTHLYHSIFGFATGDEMQADPLALIQ